MYGDCLFAGVIERCAGGNGDVRTAGTVYQNFGQDDASSEGSGDYDSFYLVPFCQSPASHHAEPEFASCLQQLFAMPFHFPVGGETSFPFGLPRMVFGRHCQDTLVYMGGISASEPVPIDSDHP